MAGNDSARRRRKYLVRKEMQLRMLVINLVYMVCSTLATTAVILYPLIALMYESPVMEVQYHASRFFLVIAGRLPLVMAVFLCIFALHHMVMTRRICGPLANFSATMRRLMQGDLTRKVRLRKSDYFKKEAGEMNGMIDSLSHALTCIQDENEALRRVLAQISVTTADDEKGRAAEKSLQSAVQQAEKISQLVAQFKIDPAVDAVPPAT
jgi:methyl-accepting chemotaxis protein